MDSLSYSAGLTPLQTRLIDTCRSLSEDEKVFIGVKDLLRVIAIEDLKLDDATFEEECEELEATVAPIEDYEPDDIGYVYRASSGIQVATGKQPIGAELNMSLD